MPFTESAIFYVLIGGLCGVLSGGLGIGSGIVLVPILVHLQFGQKVAQGMALALMVPMALMGAARYHFSPHADLKWKVVLLLTVGALVGSWLGAGAALGAKDVVLRKAFGVLLLLVGAKMAFFK